jgi:hypothetical protein
MNTKQIQKIQSEFKHKLSNLWFVYGNGGPKSTNGNHKFIQRLVEHTERGTNWTEQEWKQNKNFYKPTKECLEAVTALVKERGAELAQFLPRPT